MAETVDGSQSPLSPALSARECEALLYLAAGRTRRETGFLMGGIAVSTVRTLQLRSAAKLAANNPQHAASRHLLRGKVTRAELDLAASRPVEMRSST